MSQARSGESPTPQRPREATTAREGGLRSTLGRWGGALLGVSHPAPPSEGMGRLDAWVLGGLFVLGMRTEHLARAIASWAATRDLTGALGLLAVLAWGLVPVVAALWVLDSVLGVARRSASGMFLAPMVALGVTHHLIERVAFGRVALPPAWALIGVGAVWSVVSARRWIALTPASEEGTSQTSSSVEAPASPSPHASPSPAANASVRAVARRVEVALGVLVVAASAASAAVDARDAALNWHVYGPLAPGNQVPRVRARLLDGGRYDTAARTDRPTLLVFWTTWCGVCSSQMPDYIALWREHGEAVRIIAVNADHDPDQEAIARAYVEARALPMEVALDTGPMRAAFRVTMYPHVVLIDTHGVVSAVHQGRVSRATLAAELSALSASP